MAILAAVLAMMVAADDPPEDFMTVRGKITEVQAATEREPAAQVTVRHDRGKLLLIVGKKTRLEKVRNGKTEACSIGDVAAAVGASIEADCDSVALASNPPAVLAYRLRLVEKRDP